MQLFHVLVTIPPLAAISEAREVCYNSSHYKRTSYFTSMESRREQQYHVYIHTPHLRRDQLTSSTLTWIETKKKRRNVHISVKYCSVKYCIGTTRNCLTSTFNLEEILSNEGLLTIKIKEKNWVLLNSRQWNGFAMTRVCCVAYGLKAVSERKEEKYKSL